MLARFLHDAKYALEDIAPALDEALAILKQGVEVLSAGGQQGLAGTLEQAVSELEQLPAAGMRTPDEEERETFRVHRERVEALAAEVMDGLLETSPVRPADAGAPPAAGGIDTIVIVEDRDV